MDHSDTACRPGAPLAMRCPRCASERLDLADYPRGDDAVECRSCGDWFTFGELENGAILEARRILARTFPFLPFD